MINRNDYTPLNIDANLVLTTLLVRNYRQEPDETAAMWEFVKSEHNLFDFTNIQPLTLRDRDSLSDEAKIRVMMDSWGMSSNAMYAHYLDRGTRSGIVFTTEGSFSGNMIQRLARQFPKLELLTFSYPRNISERWQTAMFEFKGEQGNGFKLPTSEIAHYYFWKAVWGSDFPDPMAYNTLTSNIVFLDKPEELNYRYQTQNGIFYAPHTNTILDCEMLRNVLRHSRYCVDDAGDAIPDFFRP